MKDDCINIALTFSGGGYRAATFHLGVLSYLHTIKINNDTTLLNHVSALSTISGGTITGLRYMLGLCRNESVEKIFADLYSFIVNVDLATLALNNLSSYKEGMTPSLIRTMSDIYNEKLFDGARFGLLLNKVKDNHITQFSANATDFTNGLPFRFQATTSKNGKESGFGVIGNGKLRIERKIAEQIRLSEILACSTCFPGGFEPVVYPTDFDLGELNGLEEYFMSKTPFGIMDGGILDNQGIEPILLAEQRLKADFPDRKDKCLELIIISDVADPYMDAFQPQKAKLPEWMSKLNIKKLLSTVANTKVTLIIVSALITILTCILLIKMPNSFITGLVTSLFLILIGVGVVHFKANKHIIKPLKKYITDIIQRSVVKNSTSSIANLKIGEIADLVVNRFNSVKLLVMSVFMQHVRRLNYRSVYTEDAWKNRRIMNGIYELRPGESWEINLNSNKLPDSLKPSKLIQENSVKAASMGTTLWFSDEEKASGIPDSIIVTGQYTMCFNLLEYIGKLKKDSLNTNANHQKLIDCEEQLLADWENFKEDPFWLLCRFKR